MFETLIAVCLGLGLAASCGFRVFVPLLLIALAAKAEMLALAPAFEWLGSWPAIGTLTVATLLEIGAYYVPWLDNLLDSVSAPAAVAAGIVAAAACVTDMDPLLKWSLAVIAGGGSAGTIKLGMTGLRAMATATTGGLANWVVSTIEWLVSLALSLLALFIPILAALLSLILVVFLVRFAWSWLVRRRAAKRRVPATAN
ncbi:MAG: DUF4126 domain-containing protein [Pirellulaceae bacterium]|nr:DUF4126 domain-containing protein [Pirellulaceae bacterium]